MVYIKFLITVILSGFLVVIRLFETTNEITEIGFFIGKFILISVPFITFDKWIKKKKMTAAKIQNQFDCEVLKLKANDKINVVEENLVIKKAIKYQKRMKRKIKRKKKNTGKKWDWDIVDWYIKEYTEMPFQRGRLESQKMNLYYDKNLREKFSLGLYLITILISLITLGICIWVNYKFRKSISYFIFPSAPLIIFLVQSIVDNNKTTENANLLKNKSEIAYQLCQKANYNEEIVYQKLSKIQYLIYDFRCNAFLIPDFVHNKFRDLLHEYQKGLVDMNEEEQSTNM